MTKDGGPAFLVSWSDKEVPREGMSLRDYFAAMVLPEVFSSMGANPDEKVKRIAQLCYLQADAMLAEREK